MKNNRRRRRRGPWSVEDVQRHRVGLLSAMCQKCPSPCCHFGPADTGPVLNLSEEERDLFVRLSPRASERIVERPAPEVTPDGIPRAHGAFMLHGDAEPGGRLCPMFRSQFHRCGIYGDACRPTECTIFPFYDPREVLPHGLWGAYSGLVVNLKPVCPAVDGKANKTALRTNFERRLGARLQFHRPWTEDGNPDFLMLLPAAAGAMRGLERVFDVDL